MLNPDIPKNINRDMLKDIRNNTDWRELFLYLGLERDRKSTERDWWSKSPLNPGEKTASFHINDRGWTCFSTNESGYVIELVQMVIGQRTGRMMNCYEAGKWLLESGLSHLSGSSVSRGTGKGFTGNVEENGDKREGAEKDAATASTGEEDQEKENLPIRQTLLPSLDATHPEFEKRGISKETCEYLGCGYLPEHSKSPLARRVVFQVRGVREDAEQSIRPVILTHMGRAMTEEQEERDGKWWI